MDRRSFLRSAFAASAVVPVAGLAYGFAETGDVRIERVGVTVPNLPRSFDGLRVAFLTDIHHGPYVGLGDVRGFVRTALALRPDLILLGGDYTLRDAKYIRPCFGVLASLKAPLGVFGVLGNHDREYGAEATERAMADAGIAGLVNAGVWLTRGADRLRLAGVDDLWRGRPDVAAALADTKPTEACLLVSHNPDVAETMTDRRVGLMLSGHTHGGQVIAPGLTNPFIPSRYGDKYAHGLADAPTTRVYTSRGLGVTGLPVRYNCPPEITLLTLRC